MSTFSAATDTLFRTDSIELITSFSIDKTLFTVANAKDRTFIASIIDGELKEEFSFNEKLEFVDVSENMDSRNQQDSGALLKYHKGKYEMGLIDIDGYSIRQLHMYYNPDTLTFSGNDPYRSDDNIRIALWRKEPCHDISSREHQFCVKETRITREEFIHAYQHRFEYNQVRDTTLDWFTRKKVEVAVFRTLTDEEKEAYIWTDYGIQNIGRYPTGEYIADLGYANWKGAVFVDDNFQADSTVINGSDRAAYSKTGIYVGCKGFDCDDIAWLYFYRRKDGKLSRMEEIAVYINNNWRLPWYEDFPEFEGLDYNNAMVWHEGALYCFGVENYDDENGKWCVRPIFLKLELLPI